MHLSKCSHTCAHINALVTSDNLPFGVPSYGGINTVQNLRLLDAHCMTSHDDDDNDDHHDEFDSPMCTSYRLS